MFESLTNLVSGSPWAYGVVFLVSVVDAFFPLVPSETAVIAAGVLASSGDLELVLVVAAAATGAFAGDNVSYLLGDAVGEPAQRRLFRGDRGKRMVRWARRTLDEHGPLLLVVARFVPGGRTAATFVSGAVELPWLMRFAPFDALGCLLWAGYAGSLGYFGGQTFQDETWKALVLSFGIAGAITIAVELVRRLRGA